VLPLRCRRDRLDVLFSPANFRPLAYRGVNVLALHAVQHFVLDHGAASDVGRLRSKYLDIAQPRSAETADRVVAVTETLRTDALRVFDLDPDRIVAVNMGPSPWAAELLDAADQVVPHREPDGVPYVLCISRLYEHKNHRRLIEAFVRATDEGGLPHRLLVVGGDADVTREDLERQARELGAGDRVRLLGRVPQADVPGLYKGAALVAYPSLYETFGHPVLEAFAIGSPLLTSTTGATAEVAGGAAVLVDPLDVADIARGLREVLEDDALAADLVRRGDRRIRDFTWEGCGRGTVDQLVAAVEARAAGRR
jgi:glycosyltransferase involved in cell wall biosynthesis